MTRLEKQILDEICELPSGKLEQLSFKLRTRIKAYRRYRMSERYSEVYAEAKSQAIEYCKSKFLG